MWLIYCLVSCTHGGIRVIEFQKEISPSCSVSIPLAVVCVTFLPRIVPHLSYPLEIHRILTNSDNSDLISIRSLLQVLLNLVRPFFGKDGISSGRPMLDSAYILKSVYDTKFKLATPNKRGSNPSTTRLHYSVVQVAI